MTSTDPTADTNFKTMDLHYRAIDINLNIINKTEQL